MSSGVVEFQAWSTLDKVRFNMVKGVPQAPGDGKLHCLAWLYVTNTMSEPPGQRPRTVHRHPLRRGTQTKSYGPSQRPVLRCTVWQPWGYGLATSRRSLRPHRFGRTVS